MGSVIELRPQAIAQERQRDLTGAIGMMVALGSWAMMFAALFFVYLGLRSQALAWPPPGLSLPRLLPAMNTAVILLSSVTLVRALAELRHGRRRPAVALMGATFALGTLFVLLQVLLWRGMWLEGITPATGTLGTVVYALTALHAIHVVAGLLVLGYLLAVALIGGQMDRRVRTLRLCGMFWHFVDAVWVVMFVGMFVV
jgi:heme/copper-type cytochrome/quinol oxidase subunit 3